MTFDWEGEAPAESFEARCVAVVHRLDAADDKLVIAPDGTDFSDEQIREEVRFQEQFFQSEILRAGLAS